MIAAQSAAGVWIDARTATIVRWDGRAATHATIESDVPPHHRSSGRGAERGPIAHGAGGPRSAGECHRLEHVRAYLAAVRALLPADDLLLVGDGTLVDRLAREIANEDVRHQHSRRVVVQHSNPLSEPQLVARLRSFAGSPPRRVAP